MPRHLLTRVLPILAVLLALVASREARASHFRAGTLAWSVPDPAAAPNTVRFRTQYAIVAGSAVALQDITVDYGDGTNSGPVIGPIVGTGTDAGGQAYELREVTTTHTYAAPGTYTAFYEDCCRITALVNGASANYRIDTRVVLQPGNNHGPQTGSTGIIQLQSGGVRTYDWPGIDVDGDAVTCRLGTQAEAGFANPTPFVPNPPGPGNGGQSPTLAATATGCQMTWNLVDAQVGQRYVVHIMFESTHAGQVSTSALDVMVEIVAAPPPTCAGGGSFVANVGSLFTLPVVGTSGNANLAVSLLGASAGATLTPGGTAPSPFQNTFSWTPAAADVGAHVVIANYTNLQNASGACYLTLLVPSCANYGAACTAGVGACMATGINVCAGQATLCTATPGSPSPETCDGVDNNCDATTDEGTDGSLCLTGLSGVCADGTTVCNGAAGLGCAPNIAPGTLMESCDGLDNDCDGADDNGLGLGDPCTAGVGECAATGAVICDVGGGTICDAVAGMSSAELCDGLDNDCDGADDNGFNVGTACTNGVGACQVDGNVACVDTATAACDATPGTPAAEICGDGIDQDCDGTADNGCPMATSSTAASSTAASTSTGATSSSGSGGSGGEGGANAGADASGGGCGCKTTPAPVSPWAAIPALALAIVLLRRRTR